MPYQFTFPFHKYLGPGNEINNGEPVDFDDVLALNHDIAYIENFPTLVREADVHYAVDFLHEYITSGHVESLAGTLGLILKTGVERILNTQFYPMSPPTKKHKGHELYRNRQGDISKAYKDHKAKGGQDKWHEFIQNFYKTSTTESDQIAGPSGISTSERTFQQPSTSESPYLEHIDSPLSMNSENEIPMEQVMDIANGQGSGGQARGAVADSDRQIMIGTSHGKNTFSMTFKKTRIYYTYGYAFRNIIQKQKDAANQDLGDEVYLTTPLGTLPNDMIGFYCDDHEARKLNSYGSVRVIHAAVTVTPQGLRTAFDTGTTLSATATSEHCAIGCHAVDVGSMCYHSSHSYTSDAQSPMVPTAVNTISLEEICKKYYGTTDFSVHGPMCMGVPRHMNMYLCLRTNTNRILQNYIQHNEGPYNFDRILKRWNFLGQIGKPIIQWSYKPRNGWITAKSHDVPYLTARTDTAYVPGLANKYPRAAVVSQIKDGITQVIMSENVNPFKSDRPDANSLLTYSIDGGKVLDLNGETSIKRKVPLIHFGILPTPQLNPSNDNTNFQNTAAYFVVECTLTVECSDSSIYSLKGASHAAPTEAILFGPRENNAYNYIAPLNVETYGS
uniref:Capsid protein n=1 Tax=Emberiza spodocephala ambidensovirus TaxID=2794446 RepID=A0A8A4XEH5_9VIRU|nr:MAG: capsid protein [Emberiza spodocephala ambidensovirus]